MIITKTPFRMSFLGGGTDFESFFKINSGAVISTSFDKYAYVNVRHLPRFFDYKTHITYSKMEYVNKACEIEHPAIRNAMEMLDMHELRIAYDADLPARSGLGTSSSFAVGLLNAFHALKGQYADKKMLADEAIYLERVLCDEAGGIQDQIAVSYGGFNRIDFDVNGYTVKPIIISPERKEELKNNLMLFFTGFSRFSSDIQINTQKSMKNNTAQLLEMLNLVDEAEKILISKQNLEEFGKLLDYTWKLKRRMSNGITTDSIDLLYDKAINAGATGGKLLGAGGGGFLLFYVEKDKQQYVLETLHDLLYVPFAFENGGSQVIYYSPETWDFKEKAK